MTSLAQQITAAPGQPTSIRIGRVTSVNPVTVSVQGATFTDLGFLAFYSPMVGDSVALIGQSSQAGSDPASWLCLGKVSSQPSGLQASSVFVSFVALTSFTQAVVFPRPFPAGTGINVFTNINSGAGSTAGWNSRAFNITNLGFDLLVFGPSNTWSNVNVQWGVLPTT